MSRAPLWLEDDDDDDADFVVAGDGVIAVSHATGAIAADDNDDDDAEPTYGFAEALAQAQYEKAQLEEAQHRMASEYDDILDENENMARKIVELEKQLRDTNRLATTRQEEINELQSLYRDLQTLKLEKGDVEQRLRQSEEDRRQMEQELMSKEKEVQMQHERLQLQQQLQDIEAREDAAQSTYESKAAALVNESKGADVDPQFVEALQNELRKMRDLVDEKTSEVERLRRAHAANGSGSGGDGDDDDDDEGGLSLADELNTLALEQDELERQARKKLEEEAKRRAEAEQQLTALKEAKIAQERELARLGEEMKKMREEAERTRREREQMEQRVKELHTRQQQQQQPPLQKQQQQQQSQSQPQQSDVHHHHHHPPPSVQLLKEVYPHIPEGEIARVLQVCRGDAEQAADRLSSWQPPQQQQQQQQQQRQQRHPPPSAQRQHRQQRAQTSPQARTPARSQQQQQQQQQQRKGSTEERASPSPSTSTSSSSTARPRSSLSSIEQRRQTLLRQKQQQKTRQSVSSQAAAPNGIHRQTHQPRSRPSSSSSSQKRGGVPPPPPPTTTSSSSSSPPLAAPAGAKPRPAHVSPSSEEKKKMSPRQQLQPSHPRTADNASDRWSPSPPPGYPYPDLPPGYTPPAGEHERKLKQQHHQQPQQPQQQRDLLRTTHATFTHMTEGPARSGFDDALRFERNLSASAGFSITLPSQERCYKVRLLMNDCADVLGLDRKFGPQCVLKLSPNYITIVSQRRFATIVEWPLSLVSKMAATEGALMVAGWLRQLRCPGALEMNILEEAAENVFVIARHNLHEYQSRMDAVLARDLQRRELASSSPSSSLSMSFIAQLRLDDEFNKLLARETKTGFEQLQQADDATYRQIVEKLSEKSKKELWKKRGSRLKRMFGGRKKGVRPAWQLEDPH
ncbi:hypothetical protein PTSG_11656 [Salpingoeca rosetta]|uniref:CUE domain-containing protein n=1 Tax=Salpingoeca rosetta (strain ATCC 50818 / BSB-021) TaxID=946362 RepID=F2TXV0_SALR5|nr:uncharacterized protein PTSG_11656 [Salpingoeca rosetta]EGD76209.1 hypothetical protein PTSG_11656 [Salpingoeca rosetta]|eukprot:XP_004998384.1 hypothetical protein PTSG_11656 [Salpingoeca rosetta]